jgi:cyclic-di-GMP-binding protein
MPSFDVASKVDPQTADNAINVTAKEVTNRFDFKGSHVVLDLNKKDLVLSIEVDSDMKLKQVIDVLISRSMKQGLDPQAFDFSKEPFQSGKVYKKSIPIRNGLAMEDAKKVVKIIKDAGLKVQVQIMDDIVRVTGKKIDDLQEVIATLKGANLGVPLQFINMKA